MSFLLIEDWHCFVGLFTRFNFNWFSYFLCKLSLILSWTFCFCLQHLDWSSLVCYCCFRVLLRKILSCINLDLDSLGWNFSFGQVFVQIRILFLCSVTCYRWSWGYSGDRIGWCIWDSLNWSDWRCNRWSCLIRLSHRHVHSRNKIRRLVLEFGSISLLLCWIEIWLWRHIVTFILLNEIRCIFLDKESFLFDSFVWLCFKFNSWFDHHFLRLYCWFLQIRITSVLFGLGHNVFTLN